MDDLRDRYAQRAWLAAVGRTTWLQRLLTERLVPTLLRAEIHDARG